MENGWLVESDYVRAECLILQFQIHLTIYNDEERMPQVIIGMVLS